jgi:ATP/maltotriose-dependent transcriptional regulator MalT
VLEGLRGEENISELCRREGIAASAAAALTAREGQMVRLVASGLSNKEIARQLDIGLATVKSHGYNEARPAATKPARPLDARARSAGP